MKKAVLPIAFVQLLAFNLVLSLSSCGYFKAGVWENDPQNWRRVFIFEKPIGLELKRSIYIRHPHFTSEFTAYLEFKIKDANVSLLINKLSLKAVEKVSEKRTLIGEGPGIPDWFLQKSLSDYNVFNNEKINAFLFVEKKSDMGYFFQEQY